MNYLTHFHFDNTPFSIDDNYNYFYPRKSVLKIIDELSNLCRFHNGVFLIKGSDGVGKSVLLNKFIEKMQNNDFVIFIKANEKTNILKTVANKLDVDAKNIENVFDALNAIYLKGQNLILIIDDAHNLSKSQMISLSSLISVVKYLKIILCGTNELTKKIKDTSLIELRKSIVKKYKLKYLSFFECIKYISYISVSATALSQYKKVIPFSSCVLFALFTNRNMYNINYILTDALKDAFKNNQKSLRIKNVYHSMKKNFDMVKESIYLKFQKAFFYILILLSLYFAFKIIVDRYDLITNLEAKKSVMLQEIELMGN